MSSSATRGPLRLSAAAPSSTGSRFDRPSNALSVTKLGYSSSVRKSGYQIKPGGLFGATPNQRKPSLHGNTGSSVGSNRRSSILGDRRHIKDNRPLSDRSFHDQCVSNLIEFLHTNNYQHQISMKFANSPSLGAVTKIFEFLFGFFDTRLKVAPIDTEVPNLMKMLGYPFQVTKSSLKTFTTPQSLGTLFGMFEWLVHTITYMMKVDAAKGLMPPSFDGDVNLKSEMLNICLGEDITNLTDIEIQARLNELAIRKYGSEEDYSHLVDEHENLKEDLLACEEKIKHRDTLPQTLATCDVDIATYTEYIQEITRHNKEREATLKQLSGEYEEKLNNKMQLESRHACVLNQIANQDFDINEADMARERQKQIFVEIRTEENNIEELKKRVCSTKLEVSRCKDSNFKLYSDACSYITAIKEAIDSPIVIRHLENAKTLLASSEWQTLCEEIFAVSTNGQPSPQFFDNVTQLVNKLKIVILKEKSALENNRYIDEMPKLNALELEVKQAESDEETGKAKLLSLSEELETMRKKCAEEISQLDIQQRADLDQIKTLDTQMRSTDKEIRERISKLKAEITEKKATIDKKQNEIVKNLKANWEEKENEIKEMSDYLKSLQTALDGRKTKLTEVAAERKKHLVKMKKKLDRKK